MGPLYNVSEGSLKIIKKAVNLNHFVPEYSLCQKGSGIDIRISVTIISIEHSNGIADIERIYQIAIVFVHSINAQFLLNTFELEIKAF
jgi:hypothetical protein